MDQKKNLALYSVGGGGVAYTFWSLSQHVVPSLTKHSHSHWLGLFSAVVGVGYVVACQKFTSSSRDN